MFSRTSTIFIVSIMLIVTGVAQQVTADVDTEANKALVQRMADALTGEKTPELIGEFFANEEMMQHVAVFEAAFPGYVIPFEDILAEGDKVVIRGTFRGTHKGEFMGIAPTGKDMKMAVISTYRIANDKIVESWVGADQLGLMQQLGAVTPGRPAPENYVWDEPSDVTGAPGAPEENKAIVHRVIQEFWNQKNVEVLDETHSPDSLAHNPAISASYPYPQTFDVYKEACLAYLTGLPDLQVAIDYTVAEGDKVALRWTATGTHKDELMGIPATDAQVEFSGTTLYCFADGKIVDTWWAWDALGMMQQLTAPPEVDTEANKALIQRMADALGSKDKTPELLDEFIANEEMKQHVAIFEAAFPGYAIPFEDILAEGDRVVIRGTFRSTHKGDFMGIAPTGKDVTMPLIVTYRIANEKVVEGLISADQLGLMQQLDAVTPGRPATENYMWDEPSDVTGAPGTPEENKAIVHRVIQEFWNQKNVEVLDETHSPDSLAHNPAISASYPYPQTFDVYKEACLAYLTGLPDLQVAIDETIAEGDKVALRWTATGTHKDELMGIPATDAQVEFSGTTLYCFADGKIVDTWWAWDALGMMQQLTAPPEPEKDYSNVFFMPLAPGLNMISMPLEPATPYTARSFAEEIGATVVIRYDTTLGKFVGFTLSASDGGFPIEGGEGYIVNVLESKVVPFTGAAWTNEPPVEAAPPAQISDAWAFVVSGSVLEGDGMSAADDSYTAIVRNLRTGDTFTEPVDSSGYFAAAWADLSRKAVIRAGDQVEATVVDSSGEIVSGPFIHDINLDEIRNAVANLHLKLGKIIPEKTELLQNYPNPFNPETWVPYHLREANPVVIKIHNSAGQFIRTLELGYRDAGIYISRSRAAYWDGRNEAGEGVSSGVYFYTIQAGDFTATKKMILAK